MFVTTLELFSDKNSPWTWTYWRLYWLLWHNDWFGGGLEPGTNLTSYFSLAFCLHASSLLQASHPHWAQTNFTGSSGPLKLEPLTTWNRVISHQYQLDTPKKVFWLAELGSHVNYWANHCGQGNGILRLAQPGSKMPLHIQEWFLLDT